MRFNLKNEKFETFNRLSIGGARKFNPDNKYIRDQIVKLQSALKIVKKETKTKNFFPILIEYNELTAKTNRYKFRAKISNIDEIPQRNATAFLEGNEFFLSVAYQLTREEIDKFEEDIKKVVLALPKELNEDCWNKLSNVIKTNINSLSKIKAIKSTDCPKAKLAEAAYVRLYFFYENTLEMLENAQINFETIDKDNLIIMLDSANYELLYDSYSWLISKVDDGKALSVGPDSSVSENINLDLKVPDIDKSKTIIGVIDTGYDEKSPFRKWVTELTDHRDRKKISSKTHGTSVSNLIIANDMINKQDKDMLGLMKVKHFEILERKSLFDPEPAVDFNYLYKELQNIVKKNKEIKIWNLSLGSEKDPWTTGISYLGLMLDKLSANMNCIFVVASGNTAEEAGKLGESLNTPGDSVNALTVGSVTLDKKVIKRSGYSSYGRILHNFKPEIAHFGGPRLASGEKLLLDNGQFIVTDTGTSFAAPKITRLLAYYLKEGYSVTEAKAAVISDAKQITRKANYASIFGYISTMENKHLTDRFSVKSTIKMGSKEQKIIELVIPSEIERIVVASCYYVTPIPSLGEESSIIEMDARLVFYQPETNEQGKKYSHSNAIKEDGTSERKFDKELVQRFTLRKYFPTKRREYNWTSRQKDQNSQKIGLRLERLDLYDVEKTDAIDFSVVVDFYGSKKALEDLHKSNIINVENIINQDIEVEG